MELDNKIKAFMENGKETIATDIMSHCRCNNLFNIGIECGSIFISYFPKNYTILNELALCYFYTQKYEEAIHLFEQISRLNIAQEFYELNVQNKSHCIEHIKDRYSKYNPEIVNQIIDYLDHKDSIKKEKFITLTMTTCKRFSLFEKTINSFIATCTDLELIDEWICIDDNSSEEDRMEMQKKYPFFKFVLKGYEDKGHPQSLNMILDMVKSPYIFHLEDDWLFFSKTNYITQCLAVLNSNDTYGQCVLNRQYIETPREILFNVGGFPKKLENGIHFREHELYTNSAEYLEFVKKYGEHKPNSCYWYHFSLRPGLNRREIFEKCGRFDTKVSHFERVYSHVYYNNGYRTAYLDDIFCIHTGRLTSQIGDKTKLNAYDLNNEYQFSGKEEAIAKISNKEKFKTFVVNLARRPDRWDKMCKMDFGGLELNRFEAIDGLKLKNSAQLQRIFDGNDYKMRRGMVGCALSHLLLTIQLVNDKEYEYYCILEDDITPVPNFKERIQKVFEICNSEWDLIYLGHHYKNQPESGSNSEMVIEKWSAEKSLSLSLGGTGGYLLCKKGAKKLLDFINRTGMTNGIDTVQQKSANELDIYYVSPHLFSAECWRGNNNPDTDIQYNHDYMEQDIKERFNEELMFFKDEPLQVFEDLVDMVNSFKNDDKVYIYYPTNLEDSVLEMKLLSKECKKLQLWFYTLNNKVLVVVPKSVKERKIRYYNRLNKNDVYDISDAIRY